MLKKKKWLNTLLIFAIVVIVLLLPVNVAKTPNPPAEGLTYSEPGPYPAGMRQLAVQGERPLEITAWYPALMTGENKSVSTYPYHYKTFLGNIRVATLTGNALIDTPFDLSGGPYPVVLLSHGYGMTASNYAWLAEHLASYGFVVIAPEHQDNLNIKMDHFWRAIIDRPLDVMAVFSYLDAQAAPGGELAGVIDPQTVAVIGHSYGGYTSLAAGGARIDFSSFERLCAASAAETPGADLLCDWMLPHEADLAALAGFEDITEDVWPALADPRVDVIIPMAGDAYLFNEKGLAAIQVPMMVIGGTNDTGTPYAWGVELAYEYVFSPRKVKVSFEDAEHMVFIGTCETVPLIIKAAGGTDGLCSDATWNKSDVHNLVRQFTTAFLLAELTQNQTAAETLSPEGVAYPGVLYEAEGY